MAKKPALPASVGFFLPPTVWTTARQLLVRCGWFDAFPTSFDNPLQWQQQL